MPTTLPALVCLTPAALTPPPVHHDEGGAQVWVAERIVQCLVGTLDDDEAARSRHPFSSSVRCLGGSPRAGAARMTGQNAHRLPQHVHVHWLGQDGERPDRKG